VVSVPLPSVA
jgi:hypothetical protein